MITDAGCKIVILEYALSLIYCSQMFFLYLFLTVHLRLGLKHEAINGSPEIRPSKAQISIDLNRLPVSKVLHA